MDTFSLPQRKRAVGDDVYSTSEAAQQLGITRYGVETALKRGRLNGFQDPDTGRLWAWVDSVLERRAAKPASSVTLKLAELEAAIAELREMHSTARSADLAQEDVTLREVVLRLLASADEIEEASKHRDAAQDLLVKALAEQREADRLQRIVSENYREALSQMNLPGRPPG